MKSANNCENIILFDWFSCTFKKLDVFSLIDILGLDRKLFSEISGAHGYSKRLYFQGISIHYGNDRSDYISWLDMSGEGCRAFETFGCADWYSLFCYVLENPDISHITRLDVAYDDWCGLLDVFKMHREAAADHVRMKFSDGWVERAFRSDDITLYFGSKKSEVLFRCYNKKAERGRDDVDHWIRFEIQLRNDRAFQFLKRYFELGCDIGRTFSGVVSNYLNFVKPIKSESNKARWPVCSWWSKFLGNAAAISIYSEKDVEYNIFRLSNYVFENAGNAVATAIEYYGYDDFMKNLDNRRSAPNPKYQQILREKEMIDNEKL